MDTICNRLSFSESVTMKNLLNSKDLLTEKRVVAAAEALGLRDIYECHLCEERQSHLGVLFCGSTEVFAFAMRDACVKYSPKMGSDWLFALRDLVGLQDHSVITLATAEQQILAAVKAQESK